MTIGVELEKRNALQDVQNIVNEYGMDVTFYVRNEGDVDRDSYNSIEYRHVDDNVKYTLRAFPVTFQPNRKVIEKAGLREDCDCVMYTASKDWTDRGLNFESVDITRTTVIVAGIKYVIREKTNESQFYDTFLYCTFGLKRL